MDDELGSESTNFNPVIQTVMNKKGQEPIEFKTFSHPVDCFKFMEANRESILLAVSDYVMPMIDGVTLLSEVHALNEDIPCVLMTGVEETGKLKKNKWISEVLEKGPDVNDQLVNTIKKWLPA